MSIYEPPFFVPSHPQVISGGYQIGRYGETMLAAGPTQGSGGGGVPPIDLAMIEQYAPTVAKLIYGLTPDESLEVLKARVENLKKYKNVPVVNLYTQGKIAEYQGQIKALEKQAQEAKLQRMLYTAGIIVGLFTLGGIAFFGYSAGYRQLRESE